MTGIIVLAAGESKRFGGAKQLAEWNGEPLLRRAAETAIRSKLGPVNVVLGAVDEPCREILQGLDVSIVHNPRWKEGMGGSIVAGLKPWVGKPLDGIIIMLADQPGVTPQFLRALEATASNPLVQERPIVASHYAGQLGVPAWFSPKRFSKLLMLEGEKGAKSLIRSEPQVHWLNAPAAAHDIDTPTDLVSAHNGPM